MLLLHKNWIHWKYENVNKQFTCKIFYIILTKSTIYILFATFKQLIIIIIVIIIFDYHIREKLVQDYSMKN